MLDPLSRYVAILYQGPQTLSFENKAITDWSLLKEPLHSGAHECSEIKKKLPFREYRVGECSTMKSSSRLAVRESSLLSEKKKSNKELA